MTDVGTLFGRKRTIRPAGSRRVAGFTLIELMVTVAIVGILMAIAISSYEFATVKTRRNAAKGCLVEGAQYMERFYTTNFAYDKTPPPDNTPVALPDCSADVSAFYTVSFLGTPTASAFTIQAVPKSNQRDSNCGTLTVNQTGTKGAGDNSTATIAACW